MSATDLDPFYPIVPDLAWLSRLVPLGVRLIQLRLKDAGPDELRRQIAASMAVCKRHDCQLVVNDHWREAIELGADYIHLGQEDVAGADLGAIRSADHTVARVVAGLTAGIDVQQRSEPISAPNTIGILEGTDPTLKQEYLVYSAHMDHIARLEVVGEVAAHPFDIGAGHDLRLSLGDLDTFYPERMASRILGMGDVLSLIEKAEQTFDQEEAERTAKKMMDASFDLEDFLEQFQQLKKMGPLQQLVGMLPGAGSALRDVQVDERQLARVEAIIRSMTPGERKNPRSISGSRKRRIAAGSGTRPQDVNGVLKQFSQAQKMMKAMAGGRSPIPGLQLPGMPHQSKKR